MPTPCSKIGYLEKARELYGRLRSLIQSNESIDSAEYEARAVHTRRALQTKGGATAGSASEEMRRE